MRTTAKLTVSDTSAPSSATSVPKLLPYTARRRDEYGAWNAKRLARDEEGDVQRLLRRLASRPVMPVALLRLTFQTAPLLNYALPMTVVRWRDHLPGSMLGLPVPVAVMSWLSAWVLHLIA